MTDEKKDNVNSEVMKKIAFTVNREILTFWIIDKKIWYSDRKVKNIVRIMPRPDNFLKIIRSSRNRIPALLEILFNFSDVEMKEYSDAKDDEELAQIVVKDCKSKGCILMQKADITADAQMLSIFKTGEIITPR